MKLDQTKNWYQQAEFEGPGQCAAAGLGKFELTQSNSNDGFDFGRSGLVMEEKSAYSVSNDRSTKSAPLASASSESAV